VNTIVKYENIEQELPKLSKVLLNTIQSECLEIKSLEKYCDKYKKACSTKPELCKAKYVVYSKYIDKPNHPFERFIFLDEEGAEVCSVSGAEMELYGIIHLAENLALSQDYKDTHKEQC
jgi:hypothetical protein